MTDRSDKTIFKDSAQEMAVDIADMDKVLNADAKASGISVRSAGSLRKCKDGDGDRKTSRRAQRHGMLSCGDYDRSSQSPGREGI